MRKLENVKKNIRVRYTNGYYIFKLGNLLLDNQISINQLLKDINTDFGVIRKLLNGEIIRPDLSVLEKLCVYFDCKLTDIIDYEKD